MGETTTTSYLQHKKHEMRRVALKHREKIAASVDKRYVADNLMTHFFASCILQPNMPVAAYWPFRNEIDVTPLLDRINSMGCDCLLPAIVGHKKPLQFRRWKPDDTLEVSRFGNFEPPRLNPVLVPKILVIPLLGLFLGVQVIEVAEEFVEPVHGGQVFVAVAQVVLAKMPGAVTDLLQFLGQRG